MLIKGSQIKSRLFALAIVLVLTLLPGAGPLANGQAQAQPGAEIIYVPDDYPTIQGAVNAASPGDTIIVRDGNYAGNIAVTGDRLTIKSQNGAASTIVTAADPNASVFAVTADYVSIAGFTVTGATGEYQAGIYLLQSSYCDISNNTARDSYQGICLEESHHNTLTGNTANKNSQDGILVGLSGNNTLTGNTASGNGYFGIRLYFSPPNTLRSNSMTDNRCNFYSWSRSLSELRQDVDTSNKVDGKPVYLLLDRSDAVIDPSTNAGYVAVINSTNITVKDLTITHSGHGVLFAYTNNSRIENVTGCYDKHSFLLYHSHNNMVVNNNATSNIYDGFRLWNSSNNSLLNNTSNWNRYGTWLEFSDTNTLVNNSFYNNSQWGILIRDSSNNAVYLNNVLDNPRGSVLSVSSTVIWSSPEKLTYTYNSTRQLTGYLGNYWSDYRACYPGAAEVGSTGVGDTPYDIRTSDHGVPQADNCPLVAPVSRYLVTGKLIPAQPSCPLANGRYWWTIVAAVVIALLVYLVRKSKIKSQKSK
jgi:parallel beta-helix repeat protein